MRALVLAALVITLGACSKKEEAAAPKEPMKTASPTAGTVAADGVRTIPITAGMEGYVPDTIPGKPGEKLKLVFTRTVEGECLSELKTPDGTLVPLPMNKPVEVAITVPETGSLTFACGMDMFQGKIVAGG
ncbi:MAG: cupredoxin domain-containing protein [Kofleriaceae bacterium]